MNDTAPRRVKIHDDGFVSQNDGGDHMLSTVGEWERLRLELDNAKAALEQVRDALSGWNEEGDDG